MGSEMCIRDSAEADAEPEAWRLDGREAGAKPQVLRQLQQQRRLCGFVEDRRPTLEAVRSTPGLEKLPCFLVSWGYLRPQDQSGLPSGIALLHPDRFRAPWRNGPDSLRYACTT